MSGIQLHKIEFSWIDKPVLEGVELLVSKKLYSNTLTCGICTEIVMPMDNPQFCSTCQSVLFC